MMDRTQRPSDETLDDAFKKITSRLDDLMRHCGQVRERLENTTHARELRSPKNAEGNGHPFLRPVVQKAIARTAWELIKQELLTWPEFVSRLSELPWRLEEAPWSAVFSADGGKMLTGKDNTVCLDQLLRVHLAPTSFQEIKRARKSFKDIRGANYPVSEEELGKRVRDAGVVAEPKDVPAPPPEASTNDDAE